MSFNINNIGLNFDNSYLNLPDILMTNINPIPVKSPELKVFNYELAKNLDLDFNNISKSEISLFLSGNNMPMGAKAIAQAYAGHQFGYFSILGDGRAILLGEHITLNNKRYDLQLKGSGRTPYSRNGDGRATLPSMLREYLLSEAMHGLGIETTRSLSVVSTGENVQREKLYKGAILTRIASSHIRVGTFQYLSIKGEFNTLNELIKYCLNRHFPNSLIDVNPAITLLKSVIKKQISLIIDWLRVGFIHGVMNTDNMTISGETIDYGPCAFMDTYTPSAVFSSIDHNGRYSFANQSIIAHWNLSRFAETLIPFLDKSEKKAISIGKDIIDEFSDIFKKQWLRMMKGKLGLLGNDQNDELLIQKLLNCMKENNADYTNTFIYLMNKKIYNKVNYDNIFKDIKMIIEKRSSKNNTSIIERDKIMKINNPLVIPRNYYVEKALANADKENNYSLFNELLDIFKKPYTQNDRILNFQKTPDKSFEKNYKTYCGT